MTRFLTNAMHGQRK